MSQTHSIDISRINGISMSEKCAGNLVLIPNDSSIHMAVLYPMDSEGSTNTSIRSYIAHSSWW